MTKLKPIGGFFEIEVPPIGPGYHKDALALTNGRACMRWILEHEKPTRVYIPFYTCYALYQPIEKMGIEVIFYSIDKMFDPVNLPLPGRKELLVMVNYYGLKNKLADTLTHKYRKNIVIDNTHHFFHQGYQQSYSFTSARKYFGVPDGAYLYGVPKEIPNIIRNVDISVAHNVKRLLGEQDNAYRDYVTYENSFDDKLKGISLLSEHLLSGIDYKAVIQTRIQNFKILHDYLNNYNLISIDLDTMGVPFCYPFLPEQHIDKYYFHQHEIYIPTLWPDILERKITGFEWEKEITKQLLPLPIDQRYGKVEMERLIDLIFNKLK